MRHAEMSLRQRLASFAPDRETVLTIGVFDGVHLGHQHLLQQLTQLAQPDRLPAVITFTNHPITVLRPGTQVRYITTPEQRKRLLKAQGIPLVVGLEFTAEDSQVTARDFAALLVETPGMKGLIMGPGAAVGQNREGEGNLLRQLGPQLGCGVGAGLHEPAAADLRVGSPWSKARPTRAVNGYRQRPRLFEAEGMAGWDEAGDEVRGGPEWSRETEVRSRKVRRHACP